jgi:hypothetical protein
VRLCEAVRETYPPQCGGRSLRIVGLDLRTVELEQADDPSFEGVRWSRPQIRLGGRVEGDRLLDAVRAQ